VESSGPYTEKVIVPVAWKPPESVAVSEIEPPRSMDEDAWVVSVGAAITTVVAASELSFSEFGSDWDVTLAVFR
jgi:hypothetical protein